MFSQMYSLWFKHNDQTASMWQLSIMFVSFGPKYTKPDTEMSFQTIYTDSDF